MKAQDKNYFDQNKNKLLKTPFSFCTTYFPFIITPEYFVGKNFSIIRQYTFKTTESTVIDQQLVISHQLMHPCSTDCTKRNEPSLKVNINQERIVWQVVQTPKHPSTSRDWSAVLCLGGIHTHPPHTTLINPGTSCKPPGF